MRTLPIVNHLLHLAYSKKDDEDLTPLRVQKLLYLLHGWYLAITGTALFTEPFIRGTYGPSLESLEIDLSRYVGEPVADYIKERSIAAGGEPTAFFVNTKVLPQFTEVLEKVWQEYSPLSTAQLSTLGHGPSSPWARTAQGKVIPTVWILDEFTRLAAANRARTQEGHGTPNT